MNYNLIFTLRCY